MEEGMMPILLVWNNQGIQLWWDFWGYHNEPYQKVDCGRIFSHHRKVSNISFFLKNIVHETHFSSYQYVWQNLCFKMIYYKVSVKGLNKSQFDKMLYDPK